MFPSDNQRLRQALRPSGTRASTIARRLFVVAGFMILIGAILSIIAMLLGFEATEWTFVLVFWLPAEGYSAFYVVTDSSTLSSGPLRTSDLDSQGHPFAALARLGQKVFTEVRKSS